MADVRALLRQQRTARRIEHPLAAYSPAGKLLCTACNEQLKAESQWDNHLRSESHRRRVEASRKSNETPTAQESPKRNIEDAVVETSKRKHDDTDGDESRKRSKAEVTPEGRTPLRRTSSNTPSQGVEMQIPSRPATPAASRERSESGSYFTPVRELHSTSDSAVPTPRKTKDETMPTVDEGEWAAFEADIAAATAPYDEAAIISAPAVTAGDGDEQQDEQKEKVEVDIEDEKEEATRAMEDEFDEMQALEDRVKRLKERREAIAKQRSAIPDTAPDKATDHETNSTTEIQVDDDEDDEEDDWDAFRFHK